MISQFSLEEISPLLLIVFLRYFSVKVQVLTPKLFYRTVSWSEVFCNGWNCGYNTWSLWERSQTLEGFGGVYGCSARFNATKHLSQSFETDFHAHIIDAEEGKELHSNILLHKRINPVLQELLQSLESTEDEHIENSIEEYLNTVSNIYNGSVVVFSMFFQFIRVH